MAAGLMSNLISCRSLYTGSCFLSGKFFHDTFLYGREKYSACREKENGYSAATDRKDKTAQAENERLALSLLYGRIGFMI